MDLFVLSASLGLNVTPFLSGINLAQQALTGLAKSVIDFGINTVDTGMGFDKQMSAAQAVMGLTEDTAENMETMNRLRANALEQAHDSIFTAEETATAYYYMGMAGWDAEQMISGLPGVLALAAASGDDLKLTSDMVTDSLTAFGLGAGQASRFADVLAVTATESNTNVALMQQTFKNLAPIAGALGYSIEDVAISVGLIANAGVKGSQAGTALRNVFTRIATNAGATSKDLGALQVVSDELGVSFYDAAGRARPWGEVLTDMREAWRKLDPSKVDQVTAAMGEFFTENQSADDVMKEFTDDLDIWTAEWNGLTTAVERNEFISELEPMFTALGISMRDSNGNLREFSAVAQDARVKLGGLTDEEQIYYGKQIGSLRGISGWLALMTASEGDVNDLTEAIYNADGAAKAMADTRLNNLWGDTEMLKSKFDVMNIAIYDNVKGDARTIVSELGTSVDNITAAIIKAGENGGDALMAGIEQAGIEVDRLLTILEPILTPVFARLGVLLSTALSNAIKILIGDGTLMTDIINWGASLGTGLVQGLLHGIAVNASDDTKRIFSFLGINLDDYINVDPDAIADKVHEEFPEEIEVTGPRDIVYDGYIKAKNVAVELSDEEWLELSKPVTNAFKDGVERGLVVTEGVTSILSDDMESTIEDGIVKGVVAGAESWSQDGNVITYFNDMGESIATITYDSVISAESAASQLGDSLTEAIGTAGTDGSNNLLKNSMPNFKRMGDNARQRLINNLGSAGTDGGKKLADNTESEVKKKTVTIRDLLSSNLGSAGESAGSSIANGIQSILSTFTFGISIIGTIANIFGGGQTQQYAKAMSPGYILNGATVFGFSRSGQPLVGGESGPEAIIGTRSLHDLITDAVQTGRGGDNIQFNIYQQPGESAESLANKVERVLVRRERQRRASSI